MTSEPTLTHSVLMDHEYECYTPWDHILEEMTNSPDMDSIYRGIQNEIEIEHEPLPFSTDSINNDTVTHPTVLNIPPSPSTATLQDNLQSAFGTQGNWIEEAISYDHKHLVDTEPEPTFHLDILDEIEMTTSPASALDPLPVGMVQPSPAIVTQQKSEEDPTEINCTSLIQDGFERKARFKSGLGYICVKLKRMRCRTGATSQGSADFDGDLYHYEPSSDSFKLAVTNMLMFPYPWRPEPHDRDDHRYAAQLLKQHSASPMVSDHQYENDKNYPPVFGHLDVSLQPIVSMPTFEKRTYERNKSFQGHVHSLFSDALKKLEEQTGAVISVVVSYQNTLFNKTNYKDALSNLSKRKRRHSSKMSSILPSSEDESSGDHLGPREYSRPKPSTRKRESSCNSQYAVSQLCSSTHTQLPFCAKCKSNKPPGYGRDKFLAWIRCGDPLCDYLVHAACLGFVVASRKVLKTLPPYYCKTHRE